MIGDPFNLSGKTAAITGAGRGLGLEFALALADGNQLTLDPHASENPTFECEELPDCRANQLLSGTGPAPNSR